MKSCAEFEELISEFLDGTLAKDEQIALMKHMSGCPDCQKYFDDLVAMHESMEDMEEAPVPEDFSRRVMSAVRETKQDAPHKTVRAPWVRWAALAACCAVAAGGLWFFQSGKSAPASLQAAVTSGSLYVARDAVPPENGGEGIDALADWKEEPEVADAFVEADGGAGIEEPAAPAAAQLAPKEDKMAGGQAQEYSRNDTAAVSPAADASLITAEAAQEYAFQHAGLTGGDVTVTKAQLDWEDGRQVYDVEFFSPGAAYGSAERTEYDYEIDAATGAVVKFDHEAVNQDVIPAPDAVPGQIPAEEAKAIALGEVPGAAAAHITKAELDYDDGAAVYEIEIVYEGVEYDFEISASSGKIVKQDREALDKTPAANGNSSRLTLEEAKTIALGEVSGAAAEHVTKAELDYDDGAAVYEIEIVYGGMEYDLEIDAATGVVWEFDADPVD